LNRNIVTEEIESKKESRECLVHNNKKIGKIRFVEVISEGELKESLKKYGYGVYYISLVVENIKCFLKDIESIGWYLHPESLSSYEESNKIWLSRPESPILFEIIENDKLYFMEETFVDEVFIPEHICPSEFIDSLKIENLKSASISEGRIRIQNDFFSVKDFYEEIN
jgi:hypothetical protein